MKKYILLFVGALGLTACVKPVIIPAPEPPVPIVEFDCQFDGNIDGTAKNFAEGVNGYECSHLNTVSTVTGSNTTGVWYNEIHHASSSEAIRLTHGELEWPEADAFPTQQDWKDFYLTNTTPVIADAGASGIELSYTDNAGTVFKTRDTSIYPSEIFYTFVEDTAATNGSFVTFTASLNCKLYSEGGTVKMINGATLKGAYKFN